MIAIIVVENTFYWYWSWLRGANWYSCCL